MKIFSSPSWLLLALSQTLACGSVESTKSQTSIYQGVEDNGNEAVGLLIKDGLKWCSATLVAPGVALSAAHCFDGESSRPADLRIQFNGGSTAAQVTEVISHPRYSDWFGRVSNDVAVLKLDQSLSLKPIALAKSAPTSGEPVLVVGYGYADAQDVASFNGTKRKGNNVVGKVEKLKIFLPKPKDESTAQVCKGDSGGPIFATRNGQLELIGVVSGSNDTISAKTCLVESYGARVDAFGEWLWPLVYGESLPAL
ncbi:MAG: trypsin-like serine protease [Bdellovibrionota bacterium]